MSQQTNPHLSAEAATDHVQAARDEVIALLMQAEGLGDANITTWFRTREQPLVRDHGRSLIVR
jgi:hypothetical protein